LHLLFVYFKKAHDTVRREVLCNSLFEFDITKKLARLIRFYLNETYSKVRIGKLLFDTLLIQSGLKEGNALSPLLLNFASE